MILSALYDYYQRCDGLPLLGMEDKEIGFLIVITKNGEFVRFEDCRIDKKSAKSFLVKKHVERTIAVAPNYLYDNIKYVLGYADTEQLDDRLSKEDDKTEIEKLQTKIQEVKDKADCANSAFIQNIDSILSMFPENEDLNAIKLFYKKGKYTIWEAINKDVLWEDIKKNLSKKYPVFSFKIEGDLRIVAEKKELLQLDHCLDENKHSELCLITGKHGTPVETTTATAIPGGNPTAKLVAFQGDSGYDSYGKTQCANAPISKDAEFAYTTALITLLHNGSHNKFYLGNRTFLFWASSNNDVSNQVERSLFDLFDFSDESKDDPNANVIKVKKVFEAVYSGKISTSMDDRFYILGLAPNVARISVVYWSEITLKAFAGKILEHFRDMEICDNRNNPKPYEGIREMISSVTLRGKLSDATPNLVDNVVHSVFDGLPYPFTLYSSCIRRIRAEQKLTITRSAIIKAYLNRINDNQNKKITVMLDKENNNQGYLCGRLFAVLDKIQEEANNVSTIRERYMNAASSTPSSVFSTILNLSVHHLVKLNEGRKIYFEKLKQEIIEKLPSDGFPNHIDLNDQGRFFVGYYHQRQEFFMIKK